MATLTLLRLQLDDHMLIKLSYGHSWRHDEGIIFSGLRHQHLARRQQQIAQIDKYRQYRLTSSDSTDWQAAGECTTVISTTNLSMSSYPLFGVGCVGNEVLSDAVSVSKLACWKNGMSVRPKMSRFSGFWRYPDIRWRLVHQMTSTPYLPPVLDASHRGIK